MTVPDAQHSDPFAVLGMYPFPPLQRAWERLFTAAGDQVRRAGIAAPAALRWDLDPHDTWLHPDLAIGMACGWPLVTALRDQVRVVGTFAYRVGPAPGPELYRAVIVSPTASSLGDLLGRPAAINSLDSLSGHISLLEAFGCGAEWPGEVVLTGSHLRSAEAVAAGAAEVAAIDGLTWAFLQRDHPSVVAGLHVVGHGPWVPGLPLIVPASASDSAREAWRSALKGVAADPELAAVRETLLIESFVPLDLADYEAALEPLLHRHLR